MVYNVCGYWLTGRTDQRQLSWSTAAAGLVASLGLAQLSWRYFESKMIRIGHRLSDDALPATPAVPLESA